MTKLHFTSLASLLSDMEKSVPDSVYLKATRFIAESVDDIFQEVLFINKLAYHSNETALPFNFSNDFAFLNGLLAEVGCVLREIETRQDNINKPARHEDWGTLDCFNEMAEPKMFFSNIGSLLSNLSFYIPEKDYRFATSLAGEAQREVLEAILLINKVVICCCESEMKGCLTARISILNSILSDIGTALRHISNQSENMFPPAATQSRRHQPKEYTT